jgi:hypothetical protein
LPVTAFKRGHAGRMLLGVGRVESCTRSLTIRKARRTWA